MKSGPVLIGLTGSIGMGKSTTAKMFKEAGIPVWDADAAVSQLYAADGLGTKALEQLAPQAITEDGVDKEHLKALIKRDPSFLKKLEAIIHPLVSNNRNDFIEAHSNTAMVLLDIPLLFENGSDVEMDNVIVVTVPAEIQKQRVMDRGTMDEATFNLILSKQTPDAEKRAKADFVIETTSLESARLQVQNIIEKIRGQ
jgi:dephospho-CoA kinase